MVENSPKDIDWSTPGSVKIPLSIVKSIDNYKKKHGYSSRGQAIVAMIGKAEQQDSIQDLFETERKKIVNELCNELANRFMGKT